MNPYGAVTISLFTYVTICLCSVIAVYFIFKRHSKHLMSVLTMLAVGTLVGDAFLHLLPKALNIHDDVHKRENNNTIDPLIVETDDNHDRVILLKCIGIIGSIYLLYAVNCLTCLLQCGHGHSHNSVTDNNHTRSHKSTPIKQIQRLDDFVRDVGNQQEDRDKYLDSFFSKEMEDMSPELTLPVTSLTKKNELKDVAKKLRIPQIVYVVILSSVLHNLTDGLAIGVAFSDCLSGGLSTTIAVLCHEIPHVVGHFIIIHLAGLTVQTSLSVVMLSYISTFIGAYVGVTMGTQFKATDWIFAATAGMFLYVAFVQLLPEMLRDINKAKAWSVFILQNIGFFIGLGIMILIAVYEDSISIHLSHLTK